MPIVAGMGGNAATQTLTVIVRGLALGELTWVNSRKALAQGSGGRARQRRRLGHMPPLVAWAMKGDPMLGLLLGMAMVINMFVAATAGTLVPLGLRALKIDPALASSVFITTFTDVVGFASFLRLAPRFLQASPRGGVEYVRDCAACRCTQPTRSFSGPTSWAKLTGSWCS